MPTTLLTRLLSRALFFLALVAPGVLMAAVPSQFIAKQFSEALGRAPDNGSWQFYTNHFLTNGCSTGSLQAVLNGFFSSSEYTSKGYTPQETILTGYRAVLSREPDPSGFSYWVSRFNAGATASQMVFELSNSTEFANLLGAICAGDAYRQDWGLSQAMDIGSGTWTQAQLEACINSNVVCSVPPRTIIYLNSTLTIPAGKVLETSGNPDRFQYARQARIVRNSGSFVNLLTVQAGAKVRNIWLSGQRHLYKNAPTNIDEVRANIWYEGVGGAGGLVQGIRSDFPLVRSHIVSVGPGGLLDINNNLLTGYTSNHTSDGTASWITDGISQHASNGLIQNNHIIDPTDVGIVIFGHGSGSGTAQATTASSNVIVHAGLSAYGSLGFDTTAEDCIFCVFTGSFSGNTILAGQNQHSDIMLFVGTAPWTAEGATNCASGAHCGTGARMLNNTTIWGDANQRTKVQVGILVDGMLNATTSGNALYIVPQALGGCYRGPGVINDFANGHADGALQTEGSQGVHGCIGH